MSKAFFNPDVDLALPEKNGMREPAILSLVMLGAAFLAGCAHHHDASGILKLAPPASFPECTYYGYVPTCWSPWQPGWNCCPLPAVEVPVEQNSYETIPPPLDSEVGSAPSNAQPTGITSIPARSDSVVSQVAYLSGSPNAPTGVRHFGPPPLQVANPRSLSVARLPAAQQRAHKPHGAVEVAE